MKKLFSVFLALALLAGLLALPVSAKPSTEIEPFEVETWDGLAGALAEASDIANEPTYLRLAADLSYTVEDDTQLVVPAGRYAILDLAGHTLDRAATEGAQDESCLTVDGTLFLFDLSQTPGAVTGGSALYGGGVYVGPGGRLEMYGGAIRGNKAASDDEDEFSGGGGVYVDEGGSFALYGGEIAGNAADLGGGVCVDADGAFTVYDGAIRGNKASGGGGVALDQARLTLLGGEISGNEATLGGGVCAMESEILAEAGEIRGNKAAMGGGGVCALDGSVVLRALPDDETGAAPAVIGNSADDGGGGNIYLSGNNGALLRLEAGTVTDGHASWGGGVLVQKGGVEMTGGMISGDATVFGSGVCLMKDGAFTLGAGTLRDEVALMDGAFLTVAADRENLRRVTVRALTEDFTQETGYAPAPSGAVVAKPGEGVTLQSGWFISADDAREVAIRDGNAVLVRKVTPVGFDDSDGSGAGELKQLLDILSGRPADAQFRTIGDSASKDVAWLQTGAEGETLRWYGLKDDEAQFADGSQFWVKWFSEEHDGAAWQQLYDKLDDANKQRAENGMAWIFQAGVTAPDGTEVHEFQKNDAANLYVELGDDWDENDITAIWVNEGSDKRVPVSTEKLTREDGVSLCCAKLELDHFSTYALILTPKCPRDASCPLAAFSDLDAGAWYHDGVHFALENGCMEGMGGGVFAPDGATTRAQLAQLLWKLEGRPVVNYLLRYDDVPGAAWYTEAVRWASAVGIFTGYGDGRFGPDDALTREALAAALARYAKWKGADVTPGALTGLDGFDDASDISDWALDALRWAYGAGIVGGRGDGVLAPKAGASRAELAAMIQRLCETVIG